MTAPKDYETAIVSYYHTIWLLLENGYMQDSAAVQEFAVKIYVNCSKYKKAGNSNT